MIKIAICDDEPLDINALSDYINTYSNEKSVGFTVAAFLSGEELLHSINHQSEKIDILFLDIKMDKLNGVEVAKKIRGTNEAMIIVFVSSLGEYVFDAFDVEAKGFIIKPPQKSKIYEILDKSIAKLEKSKSQFLTLHTNNEIIKLAFDKIHYCEVTDHSVFVYESEKIHKYQGKIETLEKELSTDFFRCHRSYIVNLRFVDSYKDNFIYIPSGEKIPVAGRRQKEFLSRLLHFQRSEVR